MSERHDNLVSKSTIILKIYFKNAANICEWMSIHVHANSCLGILVHGRDLIEKKEQLQPFI